MSAGGHPTGLHSNKDSFLVSPWTAVVHATSYDTGNRSDWRSVVPEGTGGTNIEVAHHLSQHGPSSHSRARELLEITEAIILAVVAIATAWSGYQAALWTGHQSELYTVAGNLRVQAEGAAAAANQERLYNAATVSEWLKAEAQGQTKVAALFERRMLPTFREAFQAWKATDPVN